MRDELDGLPFDAEWIVDARNDHDLIIHVDQDGPGASLVRAARLDVDVSPKRVVEVGGRFTPDEYTMKTLAAAHAERPIDAVIVDGDVAAAPGWLAPGLADVPHGVVLGSDSFELARVLFDDRHLTQRHVMGVWAGAGAMADADFLVGGCTPAAMGIEGLPPRPVVSLRQAPQLVPSLVDPPTQLVVVSTVANRNGYASIVSRVLERVPVDAGTTIVVVVPDLEVDGDPLGSLVIAGAEPSFRSSTIVANPSADGVAHAFLSTADALVVDSPADLAIPAVAERAAEIPTLMLASPSEEPVLFEASSVPAARPGGDRLVLLADGALGDVADILDSTDSELVIVHAALGADHAARMFESLRAGGADITVMCLPDPVQGSPRHERVVPSVVAIDRRAFRGAASVMRLVADLREFLTVTMDPTNASAIHLRILPSAVGASTTELHTPSKAVRWFGTGPLPLAGGVRVERSAGPLPKQRAAQGPSARAWAKTHRWPDRIRMALPWRWGLLDRAMKDRW